MQKALLVLVFSYAAVAQPQDPYQQVCCAKDSKQVFRTFLADCERVVKNARCDEAEAPVCCQVAESQHVQRARQECLTTGKIVRPRLCETAEAKKPL